MKVTLTVGKDLLDRNLARCLARDSYPILALNRLDPDLNEIHITYRT